ncbi:MAG: hypothetical protein ABIO84_02615 [Lysobacter sp.]
MSGPQFFGEASHALFGIMHPAVTPARGAMLICQPLLQDGLNSHRGMWTVAEGLAKAGTHALRFDWYGSGDSGGDGGQLALPGMQSDLRHADAFLASVSGDLPRRWLALRSASIALLSYASRQREPVDLVLWDPCVSGRDLVSGWRAMHQLQLSKAGRFPHGHALPSADDLLGFQVCPGLLAALTTFDACQLRLPAGSRVLMVTWTCSAAQDRLMEHLRLSGTTVTSLLLAVDDGPDLTDPERFENQSLPRRSITQLLGHLNGSAHA